MTTASLLAASPYDDPSGAAGAGALVGMGIFAVVYLAIAVVAVWATVRIAQRAGYSGWWVLLSFVPIANIVVLLLFAFKEWPIERELADLRGRAALGGHGQPGGGQRGGFGGGGFGGGGYGGGGFGGGYGGGTPQPAPQPSAWPSGPSGSLG